MLRKCLLEGLLSFVADAFFPTFEPYLAPSAAMPLPKYENSELGALEEQFRTIVKQAEELSAHSELRLKELEEELKAVQSEKVGCKFVRVMSICAECNRDSRRVLEGEL